jgi:hypothetical protein
LAIFRRNSLETYSNATAIFLDEDDTGPLKRPPDDIECGAPRLANAGLELMHGDNPDPGALSEIVLGPSQKAPGRPALRCADHRVRKPQLKFWQNTVIPTNP